MTNEQLVACIQAGIDVSENMLQLWQQNQGIIGKMAMKYKGYEDIEDLKQQGYIGLCNAVNGFRPKEETTFITYAALWIRQSMCRYIDECSGVVRLPTHARSKLYQLRQFCALFEQEKGREPSDKEISLYTGRTLEEVRKTRQDALMWQISSLDSLVNGTEDDECKIVDTVASEEDIEAEVTEKVDAELLQATLWPLVDALPEECSTVIKMRFKDGLTIKETGERMSAKIGAVRQLEKRGLMELRKPRNAKHLRPFLDEISESQAYHTGGLSVFNRTWTSSTERAALK